MLKKLLILPVPLYKAVTEEFLRRVATAQEELYETVI